MGDINYNRGQLATIRNTVARDCDTDEFDLFMAAAKAYGLDPFRRQIAPVVFSKKSRDNRRMSIIVTQDGQRVLAQRCGDYRPASEPAEITYDEALKGPTNPLGIVVARVKLWKQDNQGEWFAVSGEAYWDEFVPVRNVWKDGKRTDEEYIEGNWRKMGRLMITKCATMQALRAGWPDQFSGVYSEEETHSLLADDKNASEELAEMAEEQRLKRVASVNSIVIQWLAGMPMEAVPLGSIFDRVSEWINDPTRTADHVSSFLSINAISLREYWAKEPNDAKRLQRDCETRFEALQMQEKAAAADSATADALQAARTARR